MITSKDFRKVALSLPNTTELPHFEKTSFRVRNKIFATLSVEGTLACVKLSPIDQSVFCLIDPSTIYAVPNKWGLQGWTNLNLQKIDLSVLADLLNTAYNEVVKPARKK